MSVGMRPCRTSVGGLSAALNRMHLLGILIDRLRAIRKPHPMDVRVSASADCAPARATQMVMLTPGQL
jgi:hypothetical protein